MNARAFTAVARLELAEVLRSRWILFCLALYAVLGGIFVLVGLRESGVMGFTGSGRVLFALCHALVLFLPLLGLTATGQVLNRAREEGTLELLFSHPVGRGTYFAAVSVVRFGALFVPLAVLLPGLALYAHFALADPMPWAFLFRALGTCATLLAASVGTGLLVSWLIRHQAKALMVMLLLWAGGVALLDFGLAGMMLQWRLDPQVVFTLAVLNPVQCARMALLSAADPSLATLGPVGFYLSNHIGTVLLCVLGLLWPLVVGATTWSLTLRSFSKGDLV